MTALQVAATAAIADALPVRVSPPTPGCAAVPSVSTQRTLPLRTASASHAVDTVLSRPEKPPMPATFSPLAANWAAPDWLSIATVPPPFALA